MLPILTKRYMDPLVIAFKVLRIVFYVFVIATGICFALSYYQGLPDNYWIWCGCGAIGTSVIRFFLKFML